VPVRRWISAPNIVFDVKKYTTEVVEKKHLNRPPQKSEKMKDAFVLTDFEKDPVTAQTPTTDERYAVRKDIINPRTGKITRKYVSILESNQAKGETIYRASDIETLEEFVKSIK